MGALVGGLVGPLVGPLVATIHFSIHAIRASTFTPFTRIWATKAGPLVGTAEIAENRQIIAEKIAEKLLRFLGRENKIAAFPHFQNRSVFGTLSFGFACSVRRPLQQVCAGARLLRSRLGDIVLGGVEPLRQVAASEGVADAKEPHVRLTVLSDAKPSLPVPRSCLYSQKRNLENPNLLK